MEWCRVERNHVVSVFDEVASYYDRGRGRWYDALTRTIGPVKGLVLDAGAGTGEIACRLALRGAEVVAVDSSLGMLRVLARRSRRRRVAHLVRPIAAHLPLIPLRNRCADCVIAAAVLHHLYGRQRRVLTLKEIGRVLKRNARGFVVVWYRYHPKNLLTAVKWVLRGASWGDVMVPWRKRKRTMLRYYHLYSRRELCKDIADAGLAGEVLLWDPRAKVLKRNLLAVVFSRRGSSQ